MMIVLIQYSYNILRQHNKHFALWQTAHPPTSWRCLTSLPEKEPFKEDVKPVPTAAPVEKDVVAPQGGVVTTEKDDPMDSKHMRDNLTEDNDMELLDVHEEDAHSESKEQALIRLQNFI